MPLALANSNSCLSAPSGDGASSLNKEESTMNTPIVYYGMDVAKATLELAGPTGGRTFPNTARGHLHLLRWLAEQTKERARRRRSASRGPPDCNLRVTT